MFGIGLVAVSTGVLAQEVEKESSVEQEAARPPTFADAYDHLMVGSYEQAIEAYEKLAEDAGHAVDAGLGLARCRLQTGEYEQAIADLKTLDAEGSAERHCLMAELLRRKGDYGFALAELRRAIQCDKQHAGARLLLAQTLEQLGQREEAIEAYGWFELQLTKRPELPSDAAWLTDVAVGFVRYSVLTRTNVPQRTRHALVEMLQRAYGHVDRTYWPARIAAADLLRERYNNDSEDGSVSDYRGAMRINKNLPQAYVGLGEVALEGWRFEEVEHHVSRALDINPNCSPAIHLLAKKSILERRFDQAVETCENALEINPNDLTALSLSAAASACTYDEAALRDKVSRVEAINSRCAPLYRILGDALSGIRQYEASERAYRKAIEFDPTDANARTELGMMYMQWGLEGKAREALEGSWELDPFNERTKFTLELLEMLEKFDRVETPYFIIRYDATETPGIGEFFASYLDDIHETITDDYETTLEDKTIVELFPTHRAFGVRITGKPWIHTIGACTGRVIALATPRDSTRLGSYDIAQVLRHEFTHTVTLTATHNRIPHWYTEALAVSQEDAPRPFIWSRLLADAARRDRLFTLESINWGFIRPKRPGDRQLAYAQSEWMYEFIVERFGYDVINRMLRQFREGESQTRVFQEQLGIQLEDFDRDFREWARDHVARWGFSLTPPENVGELRILAETEPDSAAVLARLARAEWDAGDGERALVASRKALAIDENEPIALDVFVKVLSRYVQEEPDESLRRQFDDEALPAAERLAAIDSVGWTGPKALGEIALRRKEYDRAVKWFKRLQHLCPMDPASWRGLAGVYLERKEDDPALTQLLELARIGERDADVPAQIAAIYKRRGRLMEARYWYRRGLDVEPCSVTLHLALGETCMQAGDTASALDEYKMLTRLEPEEVKHFENAAFSAHKMGDAEEALRFARQAVVLDPSSPARSLVK